MKQIIILFTLLLSVSALATDPFAYGRLYSKLSSNIYDLETQVQELTNKNIYIELGDFNAEDGENNLFKVNVIGSHSFDFEAQFTLTNLTEENLEEQLTQLMDLIIQEVNFQTAIRDQDMEILKLLHDDLKDFESMEDLALGLEASNRYTTFWVQLPSVNKGETRWMRTSINLGLAKYKPTNGEVGVRSTIWTWNKEVASDLDPVSNKVFLLKLGTIGANFEMGLSQEYLTTNLNIELAAAEFSKSIKINDTLKFFYQCAASIGVQFIIQEQQNSSYLPLSGKVRIGLIIKDKIALHLGLSTQIGILQDWRFAQGDSALCAEFGVVFLTQENASFELGIDYNFAGTKYPNGSSGFSIWLGFRLKL